MKKISIITTAYNAEKYIEETLESVLSQRGDFELEYIVIDATSSDSTLEKISKYKSLVDNGFYEGRNNGIEMKVISEPDEGMYEAIAKGFKLITGDIVAYINADDFYLPNALDCISHVFDNFEQIEWLTGRINGYNYLGHGVKSIAPTSYDRELIQKGLYGNGVEFIQQESCFWRRNLLTEVDIKKFREFKYAGDFYLWHCFSQKHELYVINSNLSGFRQVKTQKSSNLSAYYNEFNAIINNYQASDEENNESTYINILNIINDCFSDAKIVTWNPANYAWQLGGVSLSKKEMVKAYLLGSIKSLCKTKNGIKKIGLSLSRMLLKLNI